MGSNPSGVKIKLKDKWDLDKLSDEEPILDNLVKVQDSMRN